MLHVINARCVARDLHTIVAWPLRRMCWRQFLAQRGDCFKNLELGLPARLSSLSLLRTSDLYSDTTTTTSTTTTATTTTAAAAAAAAAKKQQQ